ncbi:hypothetical protein LTR05_006180 [Lithohypha guttulata]|uniref:Uncharacterized protein n=1 Tax=Lithohypha guttulata TaxID=1690604 RepID=A0AAN7SWS9_9EURO|nr:hypothetical protein LTR05_006180 [Lithohypha guttulata]
MARNQSNGRDRQSSDRGKVTIKPKETSWYKETPGVKRRSRTLNACEPCKRRKTKAMKYGRRLPLMHFIETLRSDRGPEELAGSLKSNVELSHEQGIIPSTKIEDIDTMSLPQKSFSEDLGWNSSFESQPSHTVSSTTQSERDWAPINWYGKSNAAYPTPTSSLGQPTPVNYTDSPWSWSRTTDYTRCASTASAFSPTQSDWQSENGLLQAERPQQRPTHCQMPIRYVDGRIPQPGYPSPGVALQYHPRYVPEGLNVPHHFAPRVEQYDSLGYPGGLAATTVAGPWQAMAQHPQALVQQQRQEQHEQHQQQFAIHSHGVYNSVSPVTQGHVSHAHVSQQYSGLVA